MFKILSSIVALGLLICPFSVPAQGAEPSRAEQLVMQDNLLTLWSMGLKQNTLKDQKKLCRDALFFLILSEGSACGLDRDGHPDFFQGMPEEYWGYVPRERVEEAARNIFGQEVTRHIAPEGTSFDGQGYFLDFVALSNETGNLCNLSANDLLPGYVSVDVMEAMDESTWEMSGWLRRFKYVDDGEILWKEATFRAIMHSRDGKLQLKEFLFEEQAMG